MMKLAKNGIIVAMTVRDADAILDFYQNVLGMKSAFKDPMDEGGMKHYLQFEGGYLKIFAPDSPPEKVPAGTLNRTGYSLLTFVVTNLEEICKVLEEKGARIVTPVQKTDTGTQWMIIADPEGNCIELAQNG